MKRPGVRSCGVKFRIYLFGGLIIWSLVSISFIECNTIKGNLPDPSLITNLVQFIQPFLQSLNYSADAPSQRSFDESPVQKAIREVVARLTPYLQDDDKDNKVTLSGSSETTIIEFLPQPRDNVFRAGKESSSELQTNIHKYEKIKSDIKAALERQSVAHKTKKMVFRALDDLIAQAIGNQCPWKSVNNTLAVFRNEKDSKHNITLEEWETLKKQYLSFLKKKKLKKSILLFNDFHQFFSKVINDTNNLSEKYKIKCQLVQGNAVEATSNGKETERTQDNCDNFKICSGELREFLIDFYKSLNDTVVSVFENYAAMYTRDVITDDEESKDINSVPTVLNNISRAVERRVSKVFIQQIKKLKFDDHKNNEVNIGILRDFVRVTCKREQKHVKRHLDSDLELLKARLLFTVKQDINMNLGLDLGNLEADMKGRICEVFVTCNGRVSEHRKAFSDSNRLRLGRNSVYVNVQLTLNDKLKDIVAQTKKKLLKTWKNNHGNSKNNYQVDFRRNDNLNVTRTTLAESTTGNIESNHSDIIGNVLKNSTFEKL